jgi:hypothetical protein
VRTRTEADSHHRWTKDWGQVNQFLALLVEDDTTRQAIEDLLDPEIVDERLHEPARPLDDVLAELGK